MNTPGGTSIEEDRKYDSPPNVDDEKQEMTLTNNTSKQPSIGDDVSYDSYPNFTIKQNRYGAFLFFIILSPVLLALFWKEKIYSPNWWKLTTNGEYWDEIQYFLRCILFPLCMISYFDTYKINTSIIEMIKHFDSHGIKLFLDLSFTLFWPTGKNTHTILMNIIVFIHWICQSWLLLFYKINIINSHSENHGWKDIFYWIKIFREVFKLHTFTAALLLVRHFFTYNQDYNARNPWNKYRMQYSKWHSKSSSVPLEFKMIIGFLFLSLLSEAYFIEYPKLNNSSNIRNVLFAYVCGWWRQTYIPLFTYPLPLILCSFIMFSFAGSYGRNIVRGLFTYFIIVTSQRTILTILSLIVVWEINTFDKNLEIFIDDIFTTIDSNKIKNRFNDFETYHQKVKILKEKLFFIVHFIVLERIISMVLDCWNFYCVDKVDWDSRVFVSRHLFSAAVVGWVLARIASFSHKYPSYIIKKLNFLNLKHFVDSRYRYNGNNENELNQTQNQKELVLWIKYLEQNNLKNDFRFVLFGGNIDLRLFAGGTLLELALVAHSKAFSKNNQETIQNIRQVLQCN